MQRYPLLGCCIPDAGKPHPYWARNDELKPSDVVQIANDSAAGTSVSDVLQHHATKRIAIDLRAGPLWRVILQGSILVVAVHHVLSDGVGSRNLLSEMFELLADSPAKLEVARSATIPPTMESTVDYRPSWMQLIGVILQELLYPRLPLWLRPRPRAIWPNPLRVKPQAQNSMFRFISISPADVSGLKSAGKSYGVKTLHPLLVTMSLYATWDAAGRPETVNVDATSPMSERKPELGHPSCTGNFIASHMYETTLAPTTGFWSSSRALATSLLSPSARKYGRGRMGMLAFVPNPDGVTVSEVNGGTQTGWETFLEKQLDGLIDMKPTIALSNLGLMPQCKGVKDVAWVQPGYPSGEALCMNVRYLCWDGLAELG